MRPGAYQVKPRLEDMDANWTEASLCFPTFPRFCGQTFLEAKDKELALLCVQAYNDWMVEEWCGESGGPADPAHASSRCGTPSSPAAEVRRNAARGVRAVCFTEIPPYLGLPSITTPTATGTRSSPPATRPAPSSACTSARRRRCRRRRPTRRAAVGSTLTFANCVLLAGRLADVAACSRASPT